MLKQIIRIALCCTIFLLLAENILSAQVLSQEKTTNPNGSITTVTKNRCNICHGSGRCSICNGQGGIWGGYGFYQNYILCRSCGASGQCRFCGGDGITTFTATYFPETGDMYGVDEQGKIYESSGTRPYSGSYNPRGNNRGSSNSSNPACPECKGDGKCTICGGDGIYYNSTYGGYIDCSTCKKIGTCGTCHGAGVIRGVH